MKMTTTKEKLLHAVQLTERVVGKKESLPVLSCVLLDVGNQSKGECSIKATNLEAGIEITIPCEVEDKGIVAVSAVVLSQTIRSISGEKIHLKTEEGNLIIESRGTKTLIKSIPHEEFPALGEGGGAKGIGISREELMRGIQSVSYAASPSMIRPELGSVYVSLRPGAVVCVATDSFRLAEKTIPSAKNKTETEVLIPLKHALELVHVLERISADEITLSADDSQMSISADGVRYMSRVVDGTFPNYKEIIPKAFETEATVLKNDFAEMLRKARVFSGNDQHVGLHIYPKRKIFSATARSAEVGEMSDSIDAALSGGDLDINFHIGYLADCLTIIESDSITLSFAGAGKPLVIRGVSDASFMYLVMPLNR
ncbi:DNA polymerase III subunit beta [Candidatus Kaiserbacteria bacterium RIFCSPHIGHO2_02_FULL_54_11b]|uniref:Beta sliding clamp n=2 Tax=Candidatus Kaiseribacteriota TaxID=1752734 RepID=A0A1F6CIH4_9BACT|nr:MAG: DNA polymerase III subunit beta [Candidatus Kaiserbacteria bacterium RIFCSPHIGHO2_01_FULL_54_36b]OGG64117.1 MAG: DNA polymerase III subunit beta [Candidatus Kaiserbacteria bacterium RIFCSPHIGHO2_02_FULL_54_11b]